MNIEERRKYLLVMRLRYVQAPRGSGAACWMKWKQ
jgi:hypothetical protein